MEKKILKKVELKKERCFPFVMVFSYLPKETIVTTGDYFEVEKHLEKYPPHLAVRNAYYVPRSGEKSISKSFCLCGKNTTNYLKCNGYVLANLCKKDRIPHGIRSVEILKKQLNINSHHKYALIYNEKEKVSLIKSFRKLPNNHIKELSEHFAQLSSNSKAPTNRN